MIVAMTEKDWVIGKDNALPWHAPEDLKHFKEKTMGCPIIMGRKTFDSIGRALPKRWNIILSSKPAPSVEITDKNAGQIIWTQNMDEALRVAREKVDPQSSTNEIFLIGGSSVFASGLPLVDRLYITWMKKEYSGDTRFPKFEIEKDFELTKERNSESDEPMRFCLYQRRR